MIEKNEKLVTFFAGISSIISLFLAIPKLSLNLPEVSFAGRAQESLISSDLSFKILYLILSESFLAYIFVRCYGYLLRKYMPSKDAAYILSIIVLMSVCTLISFSFAKTIVFDGHISTWKNFFGYVFIILIVLIIHCFFVGEKFIVNKEKYFGNDDSGIVDVMPMISIFILFLVFFVINVIEFASS